MDILDENLLKLDMNLQKNLIKFLIRKLLIISLIVIFVVIFFNTSFSQQQDDHRSIASGNWSTLAIWQKYDTSAHNWVAATSIPSASVNTITVNFIVTLDFSITVDQLVIGGTLTIPAGQSLNIGNGVGTDLTLTGAINGSGDVNLFGSADFQSGSMSGTGALNISGSGTANMTTATVTFDRAINNNGTFNWSSGTMSGSGTFNNNNVFNSTTTFGAACNMTFINTGTLNKNSNNQNNFASSFQNPGTINVTNGNITIGTSSGAVSVNGIATLGSGGTLQFGNNSSATFTINTSISGAGSVSANSTAVNFSTTCIYNITGTSTAISGTMTFVAGMTLSNIGSIAPAGGTIVLPAGLIVGGYGTRITCSGGGTLSLNTGITFNVQKVTMTGGTLTGADSITVSDSLTISTALFTGTGALTLKPGSYGTVFNNSPTIDKSIINNGTFNWTLASIFGSGTFYNNSIINMTASAFSCFMPMVNAGTINKGSNQPSQFSFNFTNLGTGIVNVTAGSLLTSAGGGTYSIAGAINISTGTIFQFGNSASATYNVTGSISGAGNFTCHTSNVNLLSGCVYNIGGNTAGTSGTMTFNAGMTLTNIGTITTAGGTINLQPGLSISSISSSITISGGGIINFNTGQKFQFASITQAGTIGGSDTISLSGTMTFSSGVLSGAGPLNVLSGAVIDINTFGTTINKTVNNSGTINWSGQGITGNGPINNNNVINILTTAGFSLNPLVNNAGTINKSTSSLTQMLGGCNNSGTVNITNGSLNLTPTSGTFTSSGAFNVSSISTLTIGQLSGTAIQNINGSISGAGIVVFNGNTVNFGPASSYDISGTTNPTSGTINFHGSMTVTNLGTFTVGSSATVNFAAGLTIGAMASTLTCAAGGTINFNTGKSYTFNQIDLGGILGGSDTVFVNTTFNWTNGTIGTPCVLVLKSGATGTVNNATTSISGKLINNGTFNWITPGVNGTGAFINNNIFNINTTSASSFAPYITNNGTLNKNNAFNNSLTNTLTNNANININTGGITLNSGTNTGTVTLTNNTTLTLNNGIFNSTGTMIIPANNFVNGNGTFNINMASLVNDGAISTSIVQFDSITNLSGTGSFNNASGLYFLNGCNVTLMANQQFRYITVSAGGTLNLNGFKASFNSSGSPIANSGTLNTTNSTIEFNGTSLQTISTGVNYKNVTVNNTAGANITGTVNVNDTLFIQTGFLNLNGNNLVLSNVGYLRENPGCLVKGTSGTISTTRAINAPSGVNIAGLGATITSSADLGSTTITRGHSPYTINGVAGLQRYYNISPANNTNLNATLVYHYESSELNGNNEYFLSLYRSTNAGTNWSTIGGQKDTANNNVTYSGINAFSYWTAATNPMAAAINITAIVDALYNTSTNTLNKKDTLTVYVRNSSAPYTVVDSAKILIDTITFTGTAFFNTVPNGTYYLTIKYRNGLETWSKSGGESYTTGTSMSYDLTSAQSQSYGNSTVLKNGKYCIVSGDINRDGFVNGNDFTMFSQQFGQSGYLGADLNGDGVVNGNDFTSFSASFGKQSSHP